MPAASCTMYFVDGVLQREVQCLPNDPDMNQQTVVVVNALADVWGPVFVMLRAANGESFPAYCRELAAGTRHLEVCRTDEQTLVLTMDNAFLENQFTPAFRDTVSDPMHPGETVDATGFHAEVLSVTHSGAPVKVRFRFDVPLEAPSLRWIAYQDGRYGPFTVPKIGETVFVNSPGFRDIARSYLGLQKETPSSGMP